MTESNPGLEEIQHESEPTLDDMGVDLVCGRDPFVHKGKLVISEGTVPFMAQVNLIRTSEEDVPQVSNADQEGPDYPDGGTVAGSVLSLKKTSDGVTIDRFGGRVFLVNDNGELEELSNNDPNDKTPQLISPEEYFNKKILVIAGMGKDMTDDKINLRVLKNVFAKPEGQKEGLEQTLGFVPRAHFQALSAVVINPNRMKNTGTFEEHADQALNFFK